MNPKLSKALWYSFFIVLLIWPALYNMFPLVTPDTGTYIHSGLAMSIPSDRPWVYGIFLLLTSWGVSPWFPVFWQGFFCAWLLIALGKRCIGKDLPYSFWAGLFLIIGGCTAAAWYNAQLMADTFTGLLLLAILLLYLKPESRLERNKLNVFIAFCLLTHVSHMLSVLIFALILLVYYHRRRLLYQRRVSAKLLCYSVAAMLLTSFSNLIGNNTFGLSACSHLFLMSRMSENGILDTYLKDQCATDPNILCPYKDSTGLRQWNFMWSGNLPHMQSEGWEKTRAPYTEIIRKTLLHPKYLGMHIVRNMEAGLKELTQIQVKEGIEQDNPPGSPVYETLKKEFPSYLKEFVSDHQNTDRLPLTAINFIIQVASLLLLALAMLLWHKRPAQETVAPWAMLFALAILYVVINAFVSATFSTVIGRLQARVFWVLPALSLYYLCQLARHSFRTRITGAKAE